MSAEITHGDLAACGCGGGKPDLTFWMDLGWHAVTCESCKRQVIDRSEAVAVALWNGAAVVTGARAVA